MTPRTEKHGLNSTLNDLISLDLQGIRNQHLERFAYYEPYPAQLKFHGAGKCANQRCFMASNRFGKTYCCCIEVCIHLTGHYPDWWNGYRYTHPVNVWVASMSREATRDILQKKYYLGDSASGFQGLISPRLILSKSMGGGVSQFVDTLHVSHQSGGISTLSFKSFDQGIDKFQGTQRHIIHLDEEPTRELYVECLLRTTATEKDFHGMILLSMVPLKGTTNMVQHFTGEDRIQGVAKEGRFYIGGTWDEANHLTEEVKQELISSMLPHEIEARTKGVPVVGTGKVFTMAEADFLRDPFEIPKHYRYVYGVDPATTSNGVWGAVLIAHSSDEDDDTIYIVKDYKMTNLRTSEHAKNIKAMLPFRECVGMIDPAGAGENQETKVQTLHSLQREHGLNLRKKEKINNAKEITINNIRERIHRGKFKIFHGFKNGVKVGCHNLVDEFRQYSRGEDGQIVKKNDHCLDALFYGMRGLEVGMSQEDMIQERRYRGSNQAVVKVY